MNAMNYPDALAWLYATQVTGIKLGLETVNRLLAAIQFETNAKIIHVAGTNGKGSVCAFTDAVCRAAGLRTGLFTSPHLLSFCERVQVDGLPIPEAAAADGLTRLRDLTANWDPPPTFFEYTTVLALDWLRRQHAEVIVLETGLGGRLDATNALMSTVSVITSIDYDHMAWLGDTLAAIAGEKAGIIKPGVPVVSAPQDPAAAEVIARVTGEQGSTLHAVCDPVPDDWKLGLAGSHQRMNAAVALAALETAGLPCSERARRAGLAGVQWPGRFQRLQNGRIILDGAHNPAAARRLAHTWHEEFGERQRATLILGILRDKDVPAICRVLASLAVRVLAVPVRSPRTASAEEIRAALVGVAPETEVRVLPGFKEAMMATRDYPAEPILMAGSFFLIGEALAELTGQPPPLESAQ